MLLSMKQVITGRAFNEQAKTPRNVLHAKSGRSQRDDRTRHKRTERKVLSHLKASTMPKITLPAGAI